jgi:hypothetical protein
MPVSDERPEGPVYSSIECTRASNARGSKATGERCLAAVPADTLPSANILRGTLPQVQVQVGNATELSQTTRAKAVVVRRAAVDYSQEPYCALNHVNRASDFNR